MSEDQWSSEDQWVRITNHDGDEAWLPITVQRTRLYVVIGKEQDDTILLGRTAAEAGAGAGEEKKGEGGRGGAGGRG